MTGAFLPFTESEFTAPSNPWKVSEHYKVKILKHNNFCEIPKMNLYCGTRGRTIPHTMCIKVLTNLCLPNAGQQNSDQVQHCHQHNIVPLGLDDWGMNANNEEYWVNHLP